MLIQDTGVELSQPPGNCRATRTHLKFFQELPNVYRRRFFLAMCLAAGTEALFAAAPSSLASEAVTDAVAKAVVDLATKKGSETVRKR